MDRDTVEPRREGTVQVVFLNGREEFNKYLLGNVLGQVVIVRNSVGRTADRLVVELIENPEGLLLSSLTLSNSLLLLQCPSYFQGQTIHTLQYIFVLQGEKVHFS